MAVLGVVVGAGITAAAAAGTGTAAASPADSGRSGANSSTSTATGHSWRTSTAVSTRQSKSSLHARGSEKPAISVVALQVRAPAASVVKPPSTVATAPKVAARATPGLPTLSDVRQIVLAAVDSLRRNLDAVRSAITVSVQRQVELVRRELTRIFGGNTRPPTPPTPPNLPADTDVVIGDVITNYKYWVAQSAETSTLTAAAMVIGQLTGTMPTLAQIIREAETTASSVQANRPMYLGPLADDWVWYRDGMHLLQKHGITTTGYYYQPNQANAALDTVKAALSQGKAVIVEIHSEAVRKKFLNEVRSDTEHQAVLLGIDTTTNVVYLNDGALPAGGRTLTMSLSDFLKAWKLGSYGIVIAELTPAGQAASATTMAA